MKCLYCDKEIKKETLATLFIQEDYLCIDCRNKLKVNRKNIKLNGLNIETLYNYDEGIFKDVLIQYKECFDEALALTFLYLLEDYIRFKYHGYGILFVPSSKEKMDLRGFNHLELIFQNIKLKRVTGIKMKDSLIQEGKNYDERKKMIDNYIYDGKKIKKVLIVDDVLTTGSSILGVYKAIKPYTVDVKGLVLSRKENAFILNNKCDKI